MTLSERYLSALSQRGYPVDGAQQGVLQQFERLVADCQRRQPKRWRLPGWIKRKAPLAPIGIYLWGPVGTGKTFLMDLFCAELGPLATRLHFHHFMQDVNQRLAHLQQSPLANPLQHVAAELARNTRVLCLDELFVRDIGDAMILSGLFQALHSQSVTLVFTSNCAPDELYTDGLQRARFLPVITLLKQITQVVRIEGTVDYRLRQLISASLYIRTDHPDAHATFVRRLESLSNEPLSGPCAIHIEGREVRVQAATASVLWFDFQELCAGPRSVSDYIAIAKQYALVAVSGIPTLKAEHENTARRLIALIDELYDQSVKLLVSANAAPQDLYQGTLLSFEWQRAASRLIEMQTEDYLRRAHRSA